MKNSIPISKSGYSFLSLETTNDSHVLGLFIIDIARPKPLIKMNSWTP